MVDRISCGILQMELPFRHTCQGIPDQPQSRKIMKTHLENGEQRITLVNPAGLTLTQAQKEQYHCD
ncbi:MAG: hypothetical protein ACLR2E_04450 [Lachnospiraceae bacterium]